MKISQFGDVRYTAAPGDCPSCGKFSVHTPHVETPTDKQIEAIRSLAGASPVKSALIRQDLGDLGGQLVQVDDQIHLVKDCQCPGCKVTFAPKLDIETSVAGNDDNRETGAGTTDDPKVAELERLRAQGVELSNTEKITLGLAKKFGPRQTSGAEADPLEKMTTEQLVEHGEGRVGARSSAVGRELMKRGLRGRGKGLKPEGKKTDPVGKRPTESGISYVIPQRKM